MNSETFEYSMFSLWIEIEGPNEDLLPRKMANCFEIVAHIVGSLILYIADERPY